MVAASVGPYGAVLADGSEFRGDYGVGKEQLIDFHRDRFDVLRDSGADLLAAETIPSIDEARALVELLSERSAARAWISFTCRDGERLRDGTPIAEAARLADLCPQVVAVGVNCTDPRHVAPLIEAIGEASSKPVVVYPNSGEAWDAEARSWSGGDPGVEVASLAPGWAAQGAWAIGGCCRVGPDRIRELVSALAHA